MRADCVRLIIASARFPLQRANNSSNVEVPRIPPLHPTENVALPPSPVTIGVKNTDVTNNNDVDDGAADHGLDCTWLTPWHAPVTA